jgi:hypothetical protein
MCGSSWSVDSPTLFVTKHHFLGWRLKSLGAPNLMRRYVFQGLRWFDVNDHFFFPLLLSPQLDFHANLLKIKEQPLILHIWSLF